MGAGNVGLSSAAVPAARTLSGSLQRGSTSILMLFAVVCLLLSSCVLASAARADATLAPPSIAGSPGLPDGRIYEQVSPADKNGNLVGFKLFSNALRFPAAAEANGEALLFAATGPIGETPSGFNGALMYVARRSGYGWHTSAAASRQVAALPGSIEFGASTFSLTPSADFSSFAFTAYYQMVAEEPEGPRSSANIFVSRNPFEAPAWVGKPESGADVIPQTGFNDSAQDYFVMGGTPDFRTLYFTYSGTLLAQDQARAANVGVGDAGGTTDPWGFYEWHDGTLSEAGVLPDGSVSPHGAVAAAIAGDSNEDREGRPPPYQAEALDNEVSSDGTHAFFVSPDPVSGASAGPSELYVREHAADGSARTVLVSRDALLAPVGGLLDGAPDGAVAIANAAIMEPLHDRPAGRSFVYASPDGSQAFFASTDALTRDALEAEEAGLAKAALKEYDFNVDTEELTYLPGVGGAQILAAQSNGSRFMFLADDRIQLWSNGPDGGQITSITAIAPGSYWRGVVGRATADGSAFVFQTDAAVPGFENGTRSEEIVNELQTVGNEQIYHYEVATGMLACVSCAPPGVVATGDAHLSYNNSGREEVEADLWTAVDTRGLSADGKQVFFDSPDPLVPQDINGKRDVYEWENGHVYLVSSGKSSEDSTFLDSSASGEDVFFATAEGLVSGDADGAYDAYDARVPRPGDSPPALPSPCEGAVCQGPPSVPVPLAAPASVSFYGLGNPLATPVVTTPSRKVTKKKHVASKKVSKKGKAKKKSARKAAKRGKSARGSRS